MEREKHTIDATGQSVGRLSTRIATLLRGKHRPSWQPHIDSGDLVEVVNAKALKFTGKKFQQKVYHHFSGYPGGLKTNKMSNVFAKDPGGVIRHSVREMLPPVKFRNAMLKRLTVKA